MKVEFMYNNKFKELCESVYKKDCFSDKPCLDEYRCTVNMRNCSISEISENDESLPIVVLILESPHRKEYNQCTKTAIRPANGSTGIAIDENIASLLLEAYGSRTPHRVCPPKVLLYLVEAISYQCSNNSKPIDHEKRDILFRRAWGKFGKKDFERRMRHLNPFAVINACTCSNQNSAIKSYINRCKRVANNQSVRNRNELKYMNALNVLVQESLDSIWISNQNVDLLYSAHPSSPNFKSKGLFFR